MKGLGVVVYGYLGGLFTGVGGLLALNGAADKPAITFGVLAFACTVLSVLEHLHARRG